VSNLGSDADQRCYDLIYMCRLIRNGERLAFPVPAPDDQIQTIRSFEDGDEIYIVRLQSEAPRRPRFGTGFSLRLLRIVDQAGEGSPKSARRL
jgi:hypothetical protein